MEWQLAPEYSEQFPQLLSEAREGSRPAKEKLFLPFESMLRELAQRGAGKRLRPERDSDVVQAVFMCAWKNFDQFKGNTEQEFASWVKSIFNNELNKIFRFHHRMKRTISRQVSLEAAVQERKLAVETEPTTLDRLISQEEKHNLAQALDKLPDEYLPFVLFRYVLGFSYEELGRRLKCSSEAARKKCDRALSLLLRTLGGD